MLLARIERNAISTFLVVLLTSIGAAAEWRTTGPPGGTIRAFAVDPNAPATIYAGTQDGVFRSQDNGATWASLNEGLTHRSVISIAVDPSDSRIIYAGTEGGGLFKSTDAGGSWTAKNEGLRPRGQRFWAISVWSVAIDPARPSQIYSGVESVMASTPQPDFPGGIFKTVDGGETWQAVIGFPLTRVSAIAIDPQNPSTLYAGTFRCGVMKSSNNGETWMPLPTPQDLDVRALRIDSGETSTIYAASLKSGVFRSKDAGLSWKALDSGLTDSYIMDVLIDPFQHSTIFAAGEVEGVFKSVDRGDHWQWTSALLQGLGLRALVGVTGDQKAVLVGSYGRGVFKTGDGGSSWTSSSKGMPNAGVTAVATARWAPKKLWATDGRIVFAKDSDGWSIKGVLPYANCGVNSFLTDPNARHTLYFAGCGAWRSENDGQGWAPMTPEGSAVIQLLALDPAVDGHIYAGTPKGVYVSHDRGNSWNATNFRDGVRGCLVADPRHARRVFACTNRELRRSDDAGRTWISLAAPTVDLGGAIVVDSRNSAVLIAGYGHELFRSRDAGATWAVVLERKVESIVVEPSRGHYFAVFRRSPDAEGQAGSIILESDDGGRSWKQTLDIPKQEVLSLAAEPLGRTLFAATGGGVYELHLSSRNKARKASLVH